ncbi:MAG: hypothetical protein R2749_03740 [Acidimicrobiales bacterium]
MSLVARHLEANGIPTVIVGSARDIVEQAGVARFLFVDFPLGNPMGKPYGWPSSAPSPPPPSTCWSGPGCRHRPGRRHLGRRLLAGRLHAGG